MKLHWLDIISSYVFCMTENHTSTLVNEFNEYNVCKSFEYLGFHDSIAVMAPISSSVCTAELQQCLPIVS